MKYYVLVDMLTGIEERLNTNIFFKCSKYLPLLTYILSPSG